MMPDAKEEVITLHGHLERKLVREVTGGARRIKVGVRVSPEGRELSLSESTWLFPGQRVSLRRAP